MNALGIDVGSSSVKMGLLKDGRLLGRAVRQSFPTRYSGEGTRAEVDPDEILKAIFKASRQLSAGRKRSIDCVALATMSPSWVAMDSRGRALTPIVTHQDRRSQGIAVEIERRVGKQRHLQLSGNRPVPGGLSS